MSEDEPRAKGFCSHVRAYVLAGILGSDVSLVLNCRERILTQLIESRVEAQCLLNKQNLRVMSVLLEALPGLCSYAAFYAAATEVTPEQAAYFFAEMDEDIYALALEVLRPVLQRCRSRLLAFSLGIEHVEGKGYRLARL